MCYGIRVRNDDDILAGKLAEIRPFLNERQWRLLLGAEARALGWGGIKRVARAAGVSPDTVGRGAGELESGVSPDGRVRAAGAGRPRVEDVDPAVVSALDRLVDPGTRGDPESPLRWTTKSTANLADALSEAGHPISPDTPGRRRESHPPPPTDPYVTVSRYTARVVLIVRRLWSMPSGRRFSDAGR